MILPESRLFIFFPRVAQCRFDSLAPPDFILFRPPPPDHITGDIGSNFKAFLLFGKLFLKVYHLRDSHQSTDHLCRLVLGVPGDCLSVIEDPDPVALLMLHPVLDRKSTRLTSSHVSNS